MGVFRGGGNGGSCPPQISRGKCPRQDFQKGNQKKEKEGGKGEKDERKKEKIGKKGEMVSTFHNQDISMGDNSKIICPPPPTSILLPPPLPI